MRFDVLSTPLDGAVVVSPRVFEDSRGFFMETYRESDFAEAGIACRFVQDNHSRSARGVLRGIHFQVRRPQAKLVRVVRGRVFDVAVDLRPDSPTFGKWHGLELSEENKLMFFVPEGFGHGFLALEDGSEIIYKCSDYYFPEYDRGLRWDDPAVGIEWPLGRVGEPLLSEKDRRLPGLEQIEPELGGGKG